MDYPVIFHIGVWSVLETEPGWCSSDDGAFSWIVILLYTFTPLPSVLGITLPLIYIVLIVCIVVGVISYAVTKGERGYMILWKEEHGIR